MPTQAPAAEIQIPSPAQQKPAPTALTRRTPLSLPASTPSAAPSATPSATPSAASSPTRPGQEPGFLESITPRPGPTPEAVYLTESMRIEIARHEEIKNSVYFTAEIWLTDASQLRSAFSCDQFDSLLESVRDIADRNGAIIAINGDFATFNNGGIIIRNGLLYRANRSTRQLLVIDQNGDFLAYRQPPENTEEAAAQLLAEGALHTLVFGPVLVENGEAVPLPSDFFISTGLAIEPRTAIAQLGPLHYLMIVVDGRQEGYSRGVSLARLQELFIAYGAQTAFNLDGGGSTTLYYDGRIINKPANGGARHVPDILYVAR